MRENSPVNLLRDGADLFPAYEQLLEQRNIPPKARPYYLRWAQTWTTAVNSEDP